MIGLDVLLLNPGLMFTILILFAAVAGSGCVSQIPPTSTIPPTPVMTTIKIAFIPLVSNGPLFIAKEEGYFAQEGINVEFEKFQSVAASLPALINGDIAVTGGPLMPGIINSVAKNASVRIVLRRERSLGITVMLLLLLSGGIFLRLVQ